MNNSVRFTCSALVGGGKTGVLKPDENGRYAMPVGALNVLNSAGQYYQLKEAQALFEQSSSFMRRVQRGVLAGEMGHPKPQTGQTEDQYAARIMAIHEDNVCCIHHEVYLDFDGVRDANGKPVVAIMSKISPAGPHGEALRRSFENPGENVCFSIRAFTDDYRDAGTGLTNRILRTIVTWDRVTEPGISVATKFNSTSLESLQDRTFSRGMLERAVKPVNGVAQESAVMTYSELAASMNWGVDAKAVPSFLKW